MTRATHGVVALPALDLRPRPDHRAELGTQLLLGESVRLLSGAPRKGWWHVRALLDGYEGWVRGWGVVTASAARAARWRARARHVVGARFADVLARRSAGVNVSPLFLGCRLIAGPARAGHRPVELPDGRRGWVRADALKGPSEPGPDLMDRVTSLLGTPYLWGGRTPAGMDCSAFTQLVLAEQGVAIPRDAIEQHAAARMVREPRLGDLAFFAAPGQPVGHVGLALGGNWFAHSRGVVRVSTLERANPMCDKELTVQFVGWGRPRSSR